MKLITLSESIQESGLEEEFLRFISEAAHQTEPTPEKIIKCISGRKYAGIYYEEENDHGKVLSGFRLIEPMVFGTGYKRGRKITHKSEKYLRAYVIMESRGDDNKQLHKINRKSVSKTNRVPYWRLFLYDRIKTWETFRFTIRAPRDGYNPKDVMIAKILKSADFDG